MKIMISSDGDALDSRVDPRFGRCKYFIVAEIEDGKIIKTEAVLNPGAEQGHGAGVKAAQLVGELKADAVLTGDLGPNSSSILDKLKISSYRAEGSVEDAIGLFLKGRLKRITDTAQPHQGLVKKEMSGGERVFFPLLDNNGMDSDISDHFGHAPFFGVYDVQKKELKIIENTLNHADPTKSPIDQIEEAVNPTTIFAKGIGGRAIGIIAQKGLSLKTGDYKTVGEAIKNLDKLDNQTQSCGHTH
jgi:predicted Fe-Mo cluster-binding NifX family protein